MSLCSQIKCSEHITNAPQALAEGVFIDFCFRLSRTGATPTKINKYRGTVFFVLLYFLYTKCIIISAKGDCYEICKKYVCHK